MPLSRASSPRLRIPCDDFRRLAGEREPLSELSGRRHLWRIIVSERAIPEPSEKISSKLVSFPVMPPAKGRLNPKRHWLIAGLASLLVVAIAGATWWALAERSTVHYVSVPVAKGPVTRTVTATGTVNPELTIIVGTAVSGIIKELNCDYNTEVKKGQTCARIDPRPYQSVVDENRANLTIAKAQLEKDKANLVARDHGDASDAQP
jgi:multidrug resistance efflux pump